MSNGKPCKTCGSYFNRALTFNADKELVITIEACMEDQVVNHGADPSKLDLTDFIEACIYSYVSDDKGIMDIKETMLKEDLQRTLN
jgi:hypothetical protein